MIFGRQDPPMARMLDKLRGLDYVVRWNFHSRAHDETVSEHSFWVAVFTILLLQLDHQQDLAIWTSALTKAIVHDFEEAVTGDGPYLVKRICGTHAWDKVVVFGMDELTADTGGIGQWLRQINGIAKDNTSGRYVHAADLFDVVKYAQDEAFRGNGKMYERIGREAIWLIRQMKWPSADELLVAMRCGHDKGIPVTTKMTHLGVDEAKFGVKQ
jgi:5'-deoxynucleotidase YfbR-like HD superfamily hydrolase